MPIELAITVVKGWGFYRFNAFARDISDRRAADEERNRLLEEAREANRMKDEFLAMLSHELRTPLSAIVGWAHMLRTGGLDEPTVARAIETIDRNAKVQNQLIEDILDVSRIVAGKFHLDMRSVDLVRIVEAAIDTVSPLAASKGVELRQDLSTEIGPCCPAVGDPDRLQQVVWNLLTNAIKFTPKGGAVTVEVQRHDEPAEFEILVRDTGQGISAEFLPHIFERFRQAGTGARRHGGLGLGLSIVRHIVEMHGGSVMATSGGEGQGSVFTLRLPVVEAGEDGQRMPALSREEGGLEEAPRLDGVRVLVVEDEADARHLLAAVLQKRGARVFMASSGAEALEMLERERPDVLLSDIALQDQDGYELIRKVRALLRGARRTHPGRRPHRLRPAGRPHARALRRLPAPRGQAGGAGGAHRGGGEPGRQERAMIEFTENGLSGRDPALARLFEREIAEAGTAVAKADLPHRGRGRGSSGSRSRAHRPPGGEKVLEWTVALPAAPGDVSRATRRALSGRRRLGERRRPARQSLDRRRS